MLKFVLLLCMSCYGLEGCMQPTIYLFLSTKRPMLVCSSFGGPWSTCVP